MHTYNYALSLASVAFWAATCAAPLAAQTHLPGPIGNGYGPVLLPHAEGGSRYRLAAGATVARDDNVFRLPHGTSPDAVGATGRSRSSTITRLYAQANADLPVGLQRFHGQLTANAYSFGGLSYLNYQAVDARAGWMWQIADRLRGELRYERTAGLPDFIDARPTVQNIRTVDAALASIDYALTPRWAVGTAFSGSNGKNSDAAAAISDSRQRAVELGLKFLGMDQNCIILFASFAQGETPNLAPSATFDSTYTQRDIGIDLVYGVSDLSSLRGRFALSERTYPNVSANDFSGPIGRLEFNWGLSPISGVRFDVRRDLAAFIEPNSTYFVNTAFGVTPWWSIAPKVKLEVSFERWNREFRGVATAGTRRSDVLEFARFALRWTPTRYVQVSTGINWSRRDSSLDAFDFVDRVVFGQIELTF